MCDEILRKGMCDEILGKGMCHEVLGKGLVLQGGASNSGQYMHWGTKLSRVGQTKRSDDSSTVKTSL